MQSFRDIGKDRGFVVGILQNTYDLNIEEAQKKIDLYWGNRT